MGKLISTGNVTFSQLRSYVECGQGGFTTASSIRGRFFTNPPSGVSSTGSFSGQFRNQWINSRCWELTADPGGTVAVISPWSSGYSTYHFPAQYAVTESYTPWVNLNAIPDSGYTFAYWYRVDPYEIWSYSANVSYYIPTPGWESTYRLTAVFNAAPPPPQDCRQYQGQDGYYEGIDCNGFGATGYAYWGQPVCMREVYYGLDMVGRNCDDAIA